MARGYGWLIDPETDQGVVVHIEAPMTVNIGPLGTWHYGKEYLEASHILREASDRDRFSPVPYQLVFQLLELLLKSFLLARGWAKRDVRKIGHDLIQLLNQAEDSGLGESVDISDAERAEVVRAMDYYGEHATRYFESPFRALTGYSDRPDIDRLAGLADRFAGSLKRVVMAAT